ncbi:hypothetical protein DL96DRAFT_1572677 [Flagelloscypha sp. PMI_526]|nr:hypothetical protein DL96DRAFT_1572677 [Flagelloscypha sp. PMI_526]
MSASLGGLSASVTRILFLTGFNKELKTKDIQSAFSDFEGVNGGFKIKWRDDTSLLVVFNDATVAKRAYLHTLAFPPAILATSTGTATIRPYDGPDAQQVIQNVNSRTHGHSASRAQNGRSASISGFNNNIRGANGSNGHNPTLSHIASQYQAIRDREPSPTLPDIPSHPTLNSLINSSLTDAVANPQVPATDPAILATSLTDASGAPPKIGDPGKRIIGAALGVRHPGLPPRVIGNGADAIKDVQKAMGGLVVAE